VPRTTRYALFESHSLQAIRADCPYVQGAEMLVEQGVEQFQVSCKPIFRFKA
jgi:shikimate 5-dehydrogenase